MAKDRIIVILGLAVLVAALSAAWWYEGTAAPAPATSGAAASAPASSTPDASSTAYAVKVTRGGTVLATFDLAALEAIGMKRVVLQGGEEQGPPLLDVLARAGASGVATVTVLGTGVRDSGRLEIGIADIGQDTVLDIAKRGTVKIAGPNIPKDDRVRDITEIQVR